MSNWQFLIAALIACTLCVGGILPPNEALCQPPPSGVSVKLGDRIVHLEGGIRFYFDQVNPVVTVVGNAQGKTDTTTFDPCDLTAISIAPCDTLAVAGVGREGSQTRLYAVTHPNPARGPVTITIYSDSDRRGIVTILDVRGNEILRFKETRFARGMTSLAWDRKDAGGFAVAAGAYVIAITTDATTISVGQLLIQ